MKRNFKLLLLLATLVSLLVGYVYMRLTFYLHQVEPSILFKSNNAFAQKKLTLFSECYCQKDLVHIENLNEFYEITVEKPAENLVNAYRLEKAHFESLFFACDLYTVLRRGPFQRVLSYHLDASDLDRNLFSNIYEQLAFGHVHYPNWTLRFYHLNTMPHALRCEVHCQKHSTQQHFYDNLDICDLSRLPFNLVDKWDASYMNRETWRLLPIADDFVSVFVSRETSMCMTREQVAADVEWLKSKTTSQLTLDERHGNAEISASLTGFKNSKNRSLARDIFSILSDEYLADNWYWSEERVVFKQFILPALEQDYSIQLPSNHKCIF